MPWYFRADDDDTLPTPPRQSYDEHLRGSSTSDPTPPPAYTDSDLERTPRIVLNVLQQAVIRDAELGKNIFCTGSAGSGKSVVLTKIVHSLRILGYRVSVTASTGRAALQINGCTIWTYASLTPDSMKKSIEEMKRHAMKRHVRTRLRETQVLVIDEISMIESNFFERLSVIMQTARGNEQPFGGVQLIVFGDFCQLPPVKPFTFCMECGKELHVISNSTE